MSNHENQSKPRFVFFGRRKSALDRPAFADVLTSYPAESLPITEMRRPAGRRPAAAPPAADASQTLASDDLRATLAQAERTLRQSITYAGSLQADLEHLDALTARLVADYRRIAATCQAADAKGTAAVEAIGAIEERLGLLHEIGRAADEGRAALDSLADEVSRAGAAFEWQWRVMEAGVAEAVRLVDEVSDLEKRASRLAEEEQPFSVAVSVADRLEQRATEASGRLAERAEDIESQIVRLDQLKGHLSQSTAAVSELEERLAGLVDTRHPAAHDLVEVLERKTAHASACLEEEREALQSLQRHVHETTGEVTRLAASVVRIDEQLTQLVDNRQKAAGERAESLERQTAALTERLEQTSAHVQTQSVRLDALGGDVVRAASEVASVEGRMDGVSARLERGANEIATQLQRIDALRNGAVDAGGALDAVQERLDRLQARHPVARGLVASLDRQLTEAATRLERSLSAAAAHHDAIESGLQKAGHLDDVVSRIEARMTRLTAAEPLLGTAEGTIDRLEKRLAAADDLLEKVTRRELSTRTRRLSVGSSRVRLRVSAYWLVISGTAAALLLAVAGGVPLLQLAGSRAASVPPVNAPPLLTAGSVPSVTPGDVPLPPAMEEPPAVATSGTAQAAARKRPANRTPAPAAAPPPNAKAQPSVFVGGLAISSEPAGADVFVNRRFVGRTPISLDDLRAGSQVVRIEHEGYRRWTASVHVPAKKRQRVQIKLEPIVSQ